MNPACSEIAKGRPDDQIKLLEGLAELDDVPLRVQRVADDGTVESPFLLARFHGAAVRVHDGADARDAVDEEHRLERCACTALRWLDDVAGG